MPDTIKNIVIEPNTITDIYANADVIAAGILVGNKVGIAMLGLGQAQIYSGATPPPTIDNASGYRDVAPSEIVENTEGDKGLFIYSRLGCTINVGDPILPSGLFSGLRFIGTQSSVESNSKLGFQHEGSTLLTILALDSNDTFFVTGSLPVSLKGRVIGYTGEGVKAEIFTGATYTGGSSAPYQNASDINPAVGLSQIIVGATVGIEGDLAFAPDYLIGNTSNQGKGTSGIVTGRENLLKPNTVYLFRLTSLDSASQSVASLLTWYEGELDLPL